MAKIPKSEAEYVEPAKKDQCQDCTMFRAPNRCTLVFGDISPKGHCRYFKLKNKLSAAQK